MTETIEGFIHPSFRHLATVPIGPTGPDDPDRFEKWSARQSYAEDMRLYRVQMASDLKERPRLEELEREKCAHDVAYYVSVYGYIIDPRRRQPSQSGLGGSGTKPWVLVEKQVQLLRWLQMVQEADGADGDGLLSKCRDVGASWLTIADSIHRWTFEDPFTTLFLSATEEFVDSKSPKALFTKVDKFLDFLPTFLKPPGFAPTRHRFHRYIANPANGNTITGDTTTGRAGRSDRVSRALIDEAAQIPDLEYVYAGLTDVTDHRIMVSTESMDEGPFFYTMRVGADVEERCSVFEFDWWDLHDADWYERQVQRYASMPNGMDHFQREVMRDPHMQSHFVYPQARNIIVRTEIERIPGMPLEITIDPGFDDACAIAFIQHNLMTGKNEVLDGYTNNMLPAAFYGPLITGELVDLQGNPIAGDWHYGERELELIEKMRRWGGKTAVHRYVGDTYGDTVNGASADSWYSVWKRNHGIVINRDRLPSGKLAAHRMQNRTHVGRRKAGRWILPTMEFADTLGARQMLVALQNNALPKPGRTGKIPESGMLRDGTTHFTSAFEFWACYRQTQADLLTYNTERNKRMEAQGQSDGPRGHRFGRRMTEVA